MMDREQPIQEVQPRTHILVAVDPQGRVITYMVVPYDAQQIAGSITEYYKNLARLQKGFLEECQRTHESCRVYVGTADSVSDFSSAFPELIHPQAARGTI